MAVNERSNKFPELPRRSLIYIALCLGGLVCFVFVGIVPIHTALNRLDQEITGLNKQLREQEILFPVFQKFLAILQQKGEKALPAPDKNKLSREEIATLPELFRELGKQCTMEYRETIPDINTLKDGSGRLRVSLLMRGDFFSLQDFLVRLGAVSFLDHIESIDIRTAMGSKDFRLKIWLLTESRAE